MKQSFPADPAPGEGSEAGFTLVEMMVAVVLVTGSVLGLLGMITSSLQAHRGQRDEAAAERVASLNIETARNGTFSDLTKAAALLPSSSQTTQGPNGKPYTTTQTLTAHGTPTQVQLKEHVTWQESGQTKSLDVTTGISDTASGLLAGAGNSTIGSLLGGAATAGISTTVSNLSVSPGTASVNSQGHPLSGVTVTATVIGLPSSATFPMTWTDDTGSHQATMTNASATTWSATLKTTDITKVTAVGQAGSLAFTATVPGSSAIPSTTLSLTPLAPPTLTCSVTPAAIVLSPLTAKTLAATALSCTSTNLASTDAVTVVYALATGNTSATLTTTTGTTWTTTLPAGTALPVNALTRFTFTGTRAIDSAVVSSTALAAVA